MRVVDPIDTGPARRSARRSQTDEKINSAVISLIRRGGPAAVTIDAVATECGVAKTTIYRRYDDRAELISGVARQLTAPPEQDHPLTQEGLGALLADVRRNFEELVGLGAIGGLLGSHSRELDDWHERLITPNLARLREFFRRGVAEEVLVRDFDYEQLIEMILGGLFASDALRENVPEEWSTNLIRLVWPTINATG